MANGIIPCLILGYSRVESLKNLVLRADSLGFYPIYISVDGPSSPEVSRIQKNLKLKLEGIAKSSESRIVIQMNSVNLGLAAGIISGIDWFFSCEDFGVILEDDLELSDDFYKFMLFGESFLKSNSDCLLVSGCRFSHATNTLALTTYPLIWGWATNRFNWKRMRKGLLTTPKKLISFNAAENYWMVGSRRVHDGFIDTWDIPLAYFMRENGFSCLLPPVNLTKNIGFDDHAVHTKTKTFPLGLPHSHLPYSESEYLIAKQGKTIEDKFLEENVYLIKGRHKLLAVNYWLTRFFRKPKYSKLRSRIVDV